MQNYGFVTIPLDCTRHCTHQRLTQQSLSSELTCSSLDLTEVSVCSRCQDSVSVSSQCRCQDSILSPAGDMGADTGSGDSCAQCGLQVYHAEAVATGRQAQILEINVDNRYADMYIGIAIVQY